MRLIDADAFKEYICNAYEQVKHMYPDGGKWAKEITEGFCKDIDEQPTIDISNNSNTLGALDCVDRAEAIKAVKFYETFCDPYPRVIEALEELPSAQPERRCVNCGRTVNNGGWYEDGRTRCPIEEHCALPKDGYCHLWEKRKDWEDDYVKRAEEGEK